MSIRVHELAKKLKIPSKELIEKLHSLKIGVKSHASTLDDETVRRITDKLGSKHKAAEEPKKVAEKPKAVKAAVAAKKPTAVKEPRAPLRKTIEKPIPTAPRKAAPAPMAPQKTASAAASAHKAAPVPPSVQKAAPVAPKPVSVQKAVPVPPKAPVAPAAMPPEPSAVKAPKKIVLKFPVSVRDLAAKLSLQPSELMQQLFKMKVMATINQVLDRPIAEKIIEPFGFEIEEAPSLEQALLKRHQHTVSNAMKPRAPVVTFMGHVDHGKTSLLDSIRKSRLTERESGGITQHIGAYRVKTQFGDITFLDTPGHEAFTAMRARGANVTDIIVLVVAADDGVMPQTVEAIDHARAAGVPIVVAINKIDMATAEPDRVKKQLAQLDLLAEDWGGKVIMTGVSAKTGEGVPHLLEMLLLEAELLELKADPQMPATGVVLEGKLSKAKGPLATVLVQEGTLRLNDMVVVGDCYGRIKAMVDDMNDAVSEAIPSKPVEILGLSGVPQAGDRFFVVEDEKAAKEIAEQRQSERRIKKLENAPAKMHMSLTMLAQDVHQKGAIQELNVILKADAQGSLGAIRDSLLKIPSEKIKLMFLHTGIGNINGSDVMLAAASDAVILGFHVEATPEAQALASEEKVEIRTYRIIYDLIDELKKAMVGMLEPQRELVLSSRAVIKQVFDLPRSGTVAGCYVIKGKLIRQDIFRVIRDKQKIFEGKLNSLKRFKNDVREIAEGFECGVKFENFNDLQEGDVIESYALKLTQSEL